MIEQIHERHPITREKVIEWTKALGEDPNSAFAAKQKLTLSEDVDGLFLKTERSSDRFHKRLPLPLGPQLRNFWFNILICCDGPDSWTGDRDDLREKRYARLQNARSDVLAMNDYYKMSVVLYPELVFKPGLRLGAGTFSEDVLVSNPTREELLRVGELCREFFEANVDDPEWRGGQINVFFSGHGDIDHSTHDATLLLADGPICATDFLSFLESCVAGEEATEPWQDFNQLGRCKLSLTLDCCHAGAFAIDAYEEICRKRGSLVPGDFRCACLPHQKAREFPKLGYGLYSYSYLSESIHRFDERDIEISEKTIGEVTKFEQIPMRFGFDEGKLFVRLPGTNIAYENLELFERIAHGFMAPLGNYQSSVSQRYVLRDCLQQVSSWCKKTKSL